MPKERTRTVTSWQRTWGNGQGKGKARNDCFTLRSEIGRKRGFAYHFIFSVMFIFFTISMNYFDIFNKK